MADAAVERTGRARASGEPAGVGADGVGADGVRAAGCGVSAISIVCGRGGNGIRRLAICNPIAKWIARETPTDVAAIRPRTTL
jgi:hypothetical protein